jgi:hypothetical protein
MHVGCISIRDPDKTAGEQRGNTKKLPLCPRIIALQCSATPSTARLIPHNNGQWQPE